MMRKIILDLKVLYYIEFEISVVIVFKDYYILFRICK